MKDLIEWLEEENRRLRKVLAIFTTIVWLLAVIVSYTMNMFGYDPVAILSLVTGQFSVVIGFYMATRGSTD